MFHDYFDLCIVYDVEVCVMEGVRHHHRRYHLYQEALNDTAIFCVSHDRWVMMRNGDWFGRWGLFLSRGNYS